MLLHKTIYLLAQYQPKNDESLELSRMDEKEETTTGSDSP
jgi:hypothetical protein